MCSSFASRKIEKSKKSETNVRGRRSTPAVGGLQHIQSFDDDDVWLADDLLLVRHDVVGFMRVDRDFQHRLSRFQIPQELEQCPQVVAFRKTFSVHEAAGFQHAVGVQESVGGHQIYLGMVGPSRQQGLDHARRGTLADSDAAGNGNHIRDRCGQGAEKRIRRLAQLLSRCDIEIQQARQRQVDKRDFFKGDAFVDAPELREVGFRQGKRRLSPKSAPLFLVETEDSA